MLIIGHRGAKGLAPENTMAAIDAGMKARSAMIEIDVRVSRDGVPLLNHDPVIKDATGKKLVIKHTDFLDLQTAKPDLFTLEAALQYIDRRVDTLIEIKPGEPVDPIVACIEPRVVPGRLESDIILASKDYVVLKKLHKAFPQLPMAVIEPWSGVRAQLRAHRLGTRRIIMNQKWLWSGFISAAKHSDYKLYAYTINDQSKARRFAKAGLYAVITDYPDRFDNSTRYL